MTDIKSILLHFDASPRSAARLRVAAHLAERFGAAVTAAYATTSAALTAGLAMGDGAGLLASAALDIDTDRIERAREMFRAARPGAAIEWTELGDPVPALGVARAALTRDLVVLGQCDRNEGGDRMVPADFVESVVVASGRPALVVPYAGNFQHIGATALVAWKATRESARALSAALPLLKSARHVHVATWGEEARGLPEYLAAHGIEARFHHEPAVHGGGLGEILLSRAADLGADLLVMGCYGHSRAREFVLGGVTRTVLESMTLPVLTVH